MAGFRVQKGHIFRHFLSQPPLALFHFVQISVACSSTCLSYQEQNCVQYLLLHAIELQAEELARMQRCLSGLVSREEVGGLAQQVGDMLNDLMELRSQVGVGFISMLGFAGIGGIEWTCNMCTDECSLGNVCPTMCKCVYELHVHQ
jgi:hypothetical protein